MADIKIFKEGESILASDTNNNNNVLLGKINDHYTQVDNYVKGELGTIKSEVGSAKADLENKISELDSKKPIYIIDAYVNGKIGYNLYSNGFCEQWGTAEGGGTRSSLAVVLPKPYANTDYNIQITSINYAGDDLGKYNYTSEAGSTKNKTKSGFTIDWSWGSRYWRTVGYATVEEV